MTLGDACFCKRISHRWDNPQGGNLLRVSRTFPEDESGLGCGPCPHVTAVAVPVLAVGVAAIAAYLAAMVIVSNPYPELLRFYGFMAVNAFGPVFDVLFRHVHIPVAVQLGFFVTVEAHHALLIVYIRCTAVFTSIFGIDAAAMAEGACLSFILLYEFVTFNKPEADSRYGRRLYMAVSAGCMAASTGLLKDFFIEDIELFFGESCLYTLSLPDGGVMN